ncbi:DMT family transporter [Limosilactobacillus mucosae]|uniref:DMT family transporter n=1 Tax=Limosilactobacillus mucosae TaxID=97478 RepID=UPI0022E12342|nr:EamA family transporter [Limosilactobacillus mucosae]
MNKRTKGILLAVTGASFWGTSGVAVQYLFGETTVSEVWLVGLRLLGAGMLLLILAKLTGRSSTKALFSNRHDVLQLVLFAFFGMGMSQLTYFAAVKYSNAPTATVIQYLAPVIIIGYTALSQKMLPRRIDVVSIIVALVGTFLLVTNGNLNHLALSPQACFWALLAALANAISTMAPGRLFARYGTLNVTAWSMLICGICFIPLYFIMPMPALRPLDVALIGWIVIGGTLLAYTLYLASVQYIDPSTTGMLGAFEPLVATILAVALLHTQFGPVNILASCLIILATFLQMMPLQIFSHRRSLN